MTHNPKAVQERDETVNDIGGMSAGLMKLDHLIQKKKHKLTVSSIGKHS